MTMMFLTSFLSILSLILGYSPVVFLPVSSMIIQRFSTLRSRSPLGVEELDETHRCPLGLILVREVICVGEVREILRYGPASEPVPGLERDRDAP